VAKRLVALAGKIRKLEELGLAETVSTRLLVNAGKLCAAGVPPAPIVRGRGGRAAVR
jgi:nitric oxide reductase NorQ protein